MVHSGAVEFCTVLLLLTTLDEFAGELVLHFIQGTKIFRSFSCDLSCVHVQHSKWSYLKSATCPLCVLCKRVQAMFSSQKFSRFSVTLNF